MRAEPILSAEADARIKAKGVYLVAMPTGISGFRGPSEPALVSGIRVKRDRLRPWTGDRLGRLSERRFELDDGHLQGHRPVVGLDGACEWLAAYPYSYARIMPA